MNNNTHLIFIFFALMLVFVLMSSSTNKRKKLDFSLQNVDGKKVSLKNYPDAKGFIIVFTCNHCPFAKLYPARLNELNNKYKDLGVPLIAISSTDTTLYEEDSFYRMVEKSNEDHYTFPYLYDAEQTAARSYGAQKTPHAFVIWREKYDWVIKYSGAIDDNGVEPHNVKEKYVEDAVDALLNNVPVITTETKSIGCQIHFRRKKD
jgi:peroxiredoxin